MKTAYYTLYAREDADMDQVSGGEDRLVRVFVSPQPRRSVRRENNVIDLSKYLARPLPEVELPEKELPEAGLAGAAAPKARTNHCLERLIRMEWLACAAMVCMAIAACVAFLV